MTPQEQAAQQAALNTLSAPSSTAIAKHITEGQANPEEVVSFGADGEVASPVPAQPAAKPVVQAEPAKPDPNAPLFTAPEVSAEPEPPAEPSKNAAKLSKDGKRNYALLPEELREYAEKLPNHLFDKFVAELPAMVAKAKKADELSAQLGERPNFLFEHPNAHLLSAEYAQLVTKQQRAEILANHYNAQITNATRGKPLIVVTGQDANGQFTTQVVNPPKEGWAPEIVEQVRQAAMLALADNNRVGQEIQQFHATAAQTKQQTLNQIAAIEKAVFGDFKFVNGEKEKHAIALSKLPAALRSHPLADLLGKAYISDLRKSAIIQSQQAELTKLRPKVPTTANSAALAVNGGAAAGGDGETFNFADNPLR